MGFEIYGLDEMRFLKLKNSKFMSADFRLRNLNKSLTNIYYQSNIAAQNLSSSLSVQTVFGNRLSTMNGRLGFIVIT